MRRLVATFCLLTILSVSGLLAPIDESLLAGASLPAGASWFLRAFSAAGVLVLLAGLVIWTRSGPFAARAFAALAAVTAIELALKLAFPDSAGSIGQIELGQTGLWLGAYPSGHAARSALLITCAAPLLPARVRPLLVCIPLIVGALMVLASGHFVSDICGGLLLGCAAGLWAREPLLERQR